SCNPQGPSQEPVLWALGEGTNCEKARLAAVWVLSLPFGRPNRYALAIVGAPWFESSELRCRLVSDPNLLVLLREEDFGSGQVLVDLHDLNFRHEPVAAIDGELESLLDVLIASYRQHHQLLGVLYCLHDS